MPPYTTFSIPSELTHSKRALQTICIVKKALLFKAIITLTNVQKQFALYPRLLFQTDTPA